MIDWLRLCRLYYSGPIALTFTLTVVYAQGTNTVYERASWIATAALFLVVAAAYVFNDARDRSVDLVNAPHRPVASGRVRPKAAAMLAAILCVAGLCLATLCRWEFAVTLVLVAAGLACYDVYSKQLNWGKPILVGVLMTSIYPLAIAAANDPAGQRAATLLFFPVWMFLTSFGYEVLKDLRDAEGDRRGVGSPDRGESRARPTRRVAQAAVIAGAAVLPVPALVGCGAVYAAIAALAIAAGFISCVLNVRRAIAALYVEFVLVGIATTADLVIAGS